MNVREEELEGGQPPTRLDREVEALVVLVAAGRSTRLPGEVPKQLLRLENLPVVSWAARGCEAAGGVVGVLPVHPPGMELEIAEALAMANLKKLLPGVEGGATRQESVARGVLALPEGPEVVLIHDAARPLVSPALVERVIAAAAARGAAIPVRPLMETVKEVAQEEVVRTLDRDRLFVSQTPQGFRRAILIEAIERGRQDGLDATDEAMLVEHLGRTVAVVPGEGRNMKITEPSDIALAEFYLQWGQI